MKLRPITRAVIFDQNKQLMLLARNRGAKFWYPPGGGWEFEDEQLLDGLNREIKEETGIENAEIKNLLFVQEFKESEDKKYLELFWLVEASSTDHKTEHVDEDPEGMVEELKWFSQENLQDLKVFPQELKNVFWDKELYKENLNNPFLGSF
jgi:ADP-ribose pyrophosphatase YjhB (NUDIX family)